MESDSDSPPDMDADWQLLDLPLGSRIGDPEESNRVIWMRFSLEQPDSNELHGIYFYRHNLSVDVFFNGAKIGGDTYREGYQTMSWNHPRLVTIQPSNWLPENNEILIKFTTSYFGGTFAPMLFGPLNELQARYEERTFRQITINQWIQYAGFIALVLSFTLWLTRRSDLTYLQFAGMTACWIVLATHMVIYYNPIEYRIWLPLVHISTDLWGWLFFHFVSQMVGISRPRIARLVSLWLALSLCWNVLAPVQYWWLGAYVLHAIGNLFILYLMSSVVRKAIVGRDRLALAICITICVQIGFFTHDFLLVLLASPEEWEGALYYSQFAFPLLMLVFVGALLHRFVSALAEAEKLNSELEDRVAAGKELIAKSLAEQHELQLKQAAARERIEIYRDLHDDVGSKLLSIVHAEDKQQDQPRHGDLARAALQSLRNAVSRANSPEQPVSTFISELVEEAQLRLEGSGHRFFLELSGSEPESILSSDQVFNLNQVTRELISNIIRHAQASAVRLRIACNGDSMEFQVADDGHGKLEASNDGNGLKNIKTRIEELGGQIEWGQNSEGGTTTSFSVPMVTQTTGAEIAGS
ncbi:MAG: hypothetical protein MI746_00985 [Pseudomonadales bacterium]|nr:hypothetical protein [Pseudomonadales bacterium]